MPKADKTKDMQTPDFARAIHMATMIMAAGIERIMIMGSQRDWKEAPVKKRGPKPGSKRKKKK